MKRIFGVTMTLLLLLITFACQPTPDYEAVVNKGDGRLEAKIEAPPVAEKPFEAPSVLRIDHFGTGEFQVATNAKVIIPRTLRFPVAEIEKRVFTKEWARELMLCMAESKPIFTYKTELPQTRSQIMAEITMLQNIF